MLWLYLGMRFASVATPYDVLADGSDVVPLTRCLTPTGVALYFCNSQLRLLQWSDADRDELRFRDYKGDQAYVRSVVLRTRSEVRGQCSEHGEGGGAVVLLARLMSSHEALPDYAPISCCCYGG